MITSRVFDAAAELKRLGKIVKPLWKVLAFSAADDAVSPQKDLCISIERHSISMAYGTRLFSRLEMKRVRNYPLEADEYPQPKDLASVAVPAMEEFGAAGIDATLSIPAAWTIVKSVEFPSTAKENLPDVIAYEFDRHLPFSPEGAFYDFRVIGEDKEKIAVSIVAARADSLNSYLEALQEKGIRVVRLTVNLSGIGALCGSVAKGADTVFVEVRNDGYESALFLDGFPIESLSGEFTAPDERSRLSMLETEITQLIVAANRRRMSPHIIALLHDGNAHLKEMIKVRMELPVAFLGETDLGIRMSGGQKSIPYAAVGGVLESLRLKENRMNLLAKGRRRGKKTPAALSILLLVSILAVWIISFVAPLRTEEERLVEIERQIKLRKNSIREIERLKKEVDTLNSEIAAINNFKTKRPMVITLLKELTVTLPKNAWLARIRVTETTVDIEGYAGSATELLPKLEASKYFRKVEFASPTYRDPRTNSDRFSIKMGIEGVKQEEGKDTGNAKK